MILLLLISLVQVQAASHWLKQWLPDSLLDLVSPFLRLESDEEVFIIELTRGKNSFPLLVGEEGNQQTIMVNLTSSFDGIALPSREVSMTEFYDPEASVTHLNITGKNSTVSENNMTDHHEVMIKSHQELFIDNNLFQQEKLQNFITFQNYDNSQRFNSSLKFFYLTDELDSSGYELYENGGYMGFTPSSWKSDMGIFHMFQHVKQESDETMLYLYSMPHTIGLELHPLQEYRMDYLTIGGYDPRVVKNEDRIVWQQSYCEEHWEIYINSLRFQDTMLMENDRGLRARISFDE